MEYNQSINNSVPYYMTGGTLLPCPFQIIPVATSVPIVQPDTNLCIYQDNTGFISSVDNEPSIYDNREKDYPSYSLRSTEKSTQFNELSGTENSVASEGNVLEPSVSTDYNSVGNKSKDNCCDKNKVMKDVSTQTDENAFSCNICKKGFCREGNLKIHLLSHYQSNYECKLCKVNFRTKSALERHQASHPTYRPYKCDKCTQSFFIERLLEEHYRSHKESQDPDSCTCKVCDRSFELKSTLSQHYYAVHPDFKAYPCDKCTRRFVRECSLKKHYLCHKESYVCDACGKGFGYKTSLIRHRQFQHSN